MKSNLQIYLKGRITQQLLSDLLVWFLFLFLRAHVLIYYIWLIREKSKIEFAYLTDPFTETLPNYKQRRMRAFLESFLISRLILLIIFLIVAFGVIPIVTNGALVKTFNQNIIITVGAVYMTFLVTYICLTYRIYNIKNYLSNYLIMSFIVILNFFISGYAVVGFGGMPNPDANYQLVLSAYAVALILSIGLLKLNVYLDQRRTLNYTKLAPESI